MSFEEIAGGAGVSVDHLLRELGLRGLLVHPVVLAAAEGAARHAGA